MTFLTEPTYDLTLLLFLASAFIKFTVTKDRESSGLKWLVSAGVFFLIIDTMPVKQLMDVGISLPIPLGISNVLLVIGFVLILVSSVKLLKELLVDK